VAVIRESALRANIELMRQYTESAGVRLAPHGKTTMCPQLFDLQLEAGAWGITCATAAHLRVYRRFGVPRIIMATSFSMRIACGSLPASSRRTVVSSFLASSIPWPARANTTMSCRSCRAGRALNCCSKQGLWVAGRVCEPFDDALLVAREVAGMSDSLRLAGIEAFEGIFPGSPAEAEVNVEAFIAGR